MLLQVRNQYEMKLNLRRDAYKQLHPFVDLETDTNYFSGMALVLISWIWILIAQVQMGLSWRVGIDQNNKTELVKHGLFSLSRNPIFLGMKISVVGIFLMLPNVLTLVSLILSWVVIDIQVRLEEEFLAATHGIKYKRFKDTVPRWLII
jgi:protein-S-isoprenylcysteine O-methyltransferase Ste14